MKTVFPIERLAHYRVIAPVIDAALRRGWPVECWLNYGAPRHGPKGYHFPDIAAAPTFRHGRPEFRMFQNQEQLPAIANGKRPCIGTPWSTIARRRQ